MAGLRRHEQSQVSKDNNSTVMQFILAARVRVALKVTVLRPLLARLPE